MNTPTRWIGVLVLATALTTGPQPATAAGQGATIDEIGTIRNDTLFVRSDLVIEAALANNEMVSASASMLDAARGQSLGAWQGFLPHVSVGAFRIRSNDPLYAFGFKLNQRSATMADFAAPPMGNALNEPGVGENNITQLKVQQPIFNGGMALYGKRAAGAMAGSQEMMHVRALETIRFNSIQACESLALATAYEAVMRQALASAEGHVGRAQAMVDNEMATEADLLQARVYRDAIMQKLIEMRNMVRVAGENIKLLTTVETELPLAPADATAPIALEGIPGFDTAAATGRADIEAGRKQANAAADMAKVARGAMLPHLNLAAEKNWYHKEDFLGDDADSWTVGIYATWDIFQGLGNAGELKKARAQSRAAGYNHDFQKRRARVEATQAGLEMQAAAEKLHVARDAVTAAREGLRIVDNMYREGLASMVDLLDVQAAATMAEGNLVQARHDYRVGLAKLDFAGGTLNTETRKGE